MRFILSVAALELLLFSYSAHVGSAAFTISNGRLNRCYNSPSFTRLHVAPDDPYADLLKAYQKKVEIPNISTDALTDSLNNAVTAASEAADKAKSAAESIPSPDDLTAQALTAAAAASTQAQEAVSSAIKSATTATTSTYTPEEGKALPLSEYLKQSDFKAETSDTLQKSQEKLAILKNNLLGGASIKVPEVSINMPEMPKREMPDVSTSVDYSGFSKKIGAVMSSGTAMTTSESFQKLVDTLHIKEYGAWYLTAFSLVYALSQKNEGKKQVQEQYNIKLSEAQQKAAEAAELALAAAEQAQKSKDLAKKVKEEEKDSQDILAESRRKQLELEKEMMKNELSNLSALTESLKTQITILTKQSTERKSVPEPEVFFADEAVDETLIPKVRQTLPRDPEEDIRILEIIKEIDTENGDFMSAKRAKEKAEAAALALKKAEEEEKIAAEARALVIEQERIAAEARAAVERQDRLAAEAKRVAEEAAEAAAIAEEKAKKLAAKVEKAQEKARLEAEAKEKKAAEEKAKKKAEADAKKKAAEEKAKIEAEEKAAKAEAEKKAAEKASAKSEKKTTKPKKAPAKSTKKVKASSEPHPWSTLAPSTLSRKNVKELTAFLSDRGIASTDENGKVLPKKLLLSSVKECL